MESYRIYSFMSFFFHIRFVRFINIAACSYIPFIFIDSYYSLDGRAEIYSTIWHQIVVFRRLGLPLKIRAGFAAPLCLSTTVTTSLYRSYSSRSKSSPNQSFTRPACSNYTWGLRRPHLSAAKSSVRERPLLPAQSSVLTLLRFELPSLKRICHQ